MKKIICYILFCIFLTGGAKAFSYSFTGITFSRDTINKKPGVIQKPVYDVTVSFDDSKLAPQNVRIIFNELFKQYIAVKDALVYNDSYGAMNNTLKLLDEMKSKTKDIEVLNKDDRWILFINNYANLRSKVQKTTFISDQRFLFNEITNGIKNFIKQFGLYDKTIYLMQCETGSSAGNAQWFSDSRDTKNPYFGLLNDTTCSKVKEVWKFK